jgi:hypothetical protein
MLINRAPAARHVGAGFGRSCSISRRISANSVLGTATSASWNVMYRPPRTTFAPIGGFRPAPRLVAEAGIGAANVLGRTTDRTPQEMADPLL